MRSAFLLLSLCSLLFATAASPAAPVTPDPSAPTPNQTLKPGDSAPDFTLTDLQGNVHSLSEHTSAGQVVVLEWVNPACPAVAKFQTQSRFMRDTATAFRHQPVVWLAIDSNAPGANGSSDTAALEQFVKDSHLAAPVLLDYPGATGRSYGAVSTPTFFVISPRSVVIYSGAPDASTALDKAPAGENYLRDAISAALAGRTPRVSQARAYGCPVRYARQPLPGRTQPTPPAPAPPAAKPVPPPQSGGQA